MTSTAPKTADPFTAQLPGTEDQNGETEKTTTRRPTSRPVPKTPQEMTPQEVTPQADGIETEAPTTAVQVSRPATRQAPPNTGPGAGPRPGAGPGGPRPQTPFGKPGGDDDFVIDLNGIDLSGGFVGVGVHLGYISDIVKSQSKAGNPMIVWTASVYQGDFQGKSMKLYTALTPDAMWKFVEVLDAIGYQMPEDKRPVFGDVKKAGIRTLVLMNVVEGEYNGAPRPQLDSFLIPENGPGIKIPDPSIPR